MNSKLKPKIRFKRFTDDWEQRKLGEIGNTFTGLSGKTKEDFGHGEAKFVTYMNVFSNPIAQFNKTEPIEIDNKQNQVEYGDVFFTTSSETPDEVGMSSVWLENKGNIYLNSFCFGFRPFVKNDPYYMAYMLRSKNFRKNMTLLAQGISRYNISKNGVMNIDIQLPINQEQEKIGKLFYEIDNLITLHQRKCDKLIEIKKSLLEKMFPQNNSVIPEIRFRGFTDDWEQRKLNDIYTFSQGMQVEIENQSLNKSVDMEQFIRIIDVTTNSEPPRYIYNTTGKGHVESNDIFFVRYGAVGTVGYGYTGTIANNLFKLSTNKKYCNDFMYQQFANGEFNKKLIEMSASTSMPAINFSALNSLTFYETNLDEQNRIGKLFKSIDNLITLHQRKHDKLNKIKQSLLNDMFV